MGDIGWIWKESISEEGQVVEGGDGHLAGGCKQAEVKEWRISSSFGLSSGSFLQHSSTMSQMGFRIDGSRGCLGLSPLTTESTIASLA